MADFASWKQESLAAYAAEVSEENRVLREDNKLLLAAWRQAVTERYLAGVPDGSPTRPLPPQFSPIAEGMPCAGQR